MRKRDVLLGIGIGLAIPPAVELYSEWCDDKMEQKIREVLNEVHPEVEVKEKKVNPVVKFMKSKNKKEKLKSLYSTSKLLMD